MIQLPVGARADLVADSRLKVHVDGAGNVLVVFARSEWGVSVLNNGCVC